jgi:hypothetical protein
MRTALDRVRLDRLQNLSHRARGLYIAKHRGSECSEIVSYAIGEGGVELA